MPNAKDPVWYLLEKIEGSIDKVEANQTVALVAMNDLSNNVKYMGFRVDRLDKILSEDDNGRPGLVAQSRNLQLSVQELSSNFREIQDTLKGITNDLSALKKEAGLKTPKEVSIERAKTLGKVAAGLTALAPGIIAFIDRFLG
jgi:hypothetical protein